MRKIKSDWKSERSGEGGGGGGFHSIKRVLLFCPVAFGVVRDV